METFNIVLLKKAKSIGIITYNAKRRKGCPNRHPGLLSLQQSIAESRIVAEESRRDIVPGGLGATDWLSLGYGIVQAVADVSCPGYGFAGIGFGLVF